MSEIGAYEAKTHLPRLLERVQKGERFIITRHGEPVAALVPIEARDSDGIRRAIAGVRAMRQKLARRGVTLQGILEPGETLRDLAGRGRRY